MRTLKLTLAYDGTDYAGWQVQPGRTTIQGTLQDALKQILGEPVNVVGSGRTDAGVHALGQVAHARVHSMMPVDRLHRALNANLGRSIVVLSLDEAPPSFNAQYDARRKRYRYSIINAPFALPFEWRYVHRVPIPLNVARMRGELRALIGRHDFRPFHRAGRIVPDARRTVFFAGLTRRGPRLDIEIEANGFLYMMMRALVGTLLDVGRGARPAGTIATILKTGDRGLVGPTAPARGLCLVSVGYTGPRRR